MYVESEWFEYLLLVVCIVIKFVKCNGADRPGGH